MFLAKTFIHIIFVSTISLCFICHNLKLKILQGMALKDVPDLGDAESRPLQLDFRVYMCVCLREKERVRAEAEEIRKINSSRGDIIKTDEQR